MKKILSLATPLIQSTISFTLRALQPQGPSMARSKVSKKLFTLLDLCVSSLRRGHANLLCIVPILSDDPRRESDLKSIYGLMKQHAILVCCFLCLGMGTSFLLFSLLLWNNVVLCVACVCKVCGFLMCVFLVVCV